MCDLIFQALRDMRQREKSVPRLKTAVACLALVAGALFPARAGRAEAGLRVVTIHAKRFGFQPSEITLLQGRTSMLRFISDDVTHGITVEKLGIDLLFSGNHPKEVTVTPAEAGDFAGRCSRYCGAGHSSMVFIVHVIR